MTEGFLLDQGRCTGCSACRLGCTIENQLDWDRSWRRVHTANPERQPGAATLHLSSACHHCQDPACLRACPALAIQQLDDGTVQLDDTRCIGCRYCSWACPYDAPLYDPARGVMSKCTSCPERRADGHPPACVTACPTGALDWGELARGLPLEPVMTAAALQPRMRLIPPRASAASAAAPQELPVWTGDRNGAPVQLRAEWSLALFTLAASFLVAWTAAADWLDKPVELGPFLALALVASGLAASHLGSPRRAWRAVLHARRSWLSREILAWHAFVAAGLLTAARGPLDQGAAGMAALLGLVTLVCVDRVYSVLRRRGPRGPHSGSALLSGLFLFALLGGVPDLMLALLVLRGVLFLRRVAATRPARLWLWLPLRLLGLASGLTALDLWFEPPLVAALAVALVGEAVDRGLFYTELERRPPMS